MTAPMTVRRILKSSASFHNEAREIIHAIFISEFLCPSRCLWLASPWLSDIRIIDNSTGAYGAIDPTWGRRGIRLIEILIGLVSRGTTLVLVTRPDPHNKTFLRQLTCLVEDAGFQERLLVLSDREKLHHKGLLGDTFYLNGSMNFTYNGLEILEEEVVLETALEQVAEARLEYFNRYGGVL